MYRILAVFLMLALVGIAWGTTRNVPASYATIQAAIDAAVSNDVINIAAGTYTEYLNITKPLTIKGAGISGASITTIKPPVADWPFIVTSYPQWSNGIGVSTNLYGHVLVHLTPPIRIW